MTPFHPTQWPSAKRDAAQALWDFYHALSRPESGFPFDRTTRQCIDGMQTDTMPPATVQNAYDACEKYGLDRALLAQVVEGARHLVPPVQFESAAQLLDFVRLRCGAHARLLAQLAGQKGRFRMQGTVEFAKAVFLTKQLCRLPHDIAEGRLFIPLAELVQFKVTRAQLRQGTMDNNMRRLLWKQAVRIRDAYGASQRLGHDLSGWPRRQFRKHWMEGLYLLSAVEKKRFDVWTKPVELSSVRRLQMRWQLFTGKTSFR